MTKQNGPHFDEDHLRQGSPVNTTFVESIPRYLGGTDGAIAATGVCLAVAVPVQVGDLLSNVTFVTGGTGAGTPTAGVVGIYNAAGALVASSADLATTARAADTAYTVAMTTPYLVTVAGIYWVSISFTATTVPTLVGLALDNAAIADDIGTTPATAVLVQSHGSAVAGTAPATIATPTVTAVMPYVAVT